MFYTHHASEERGPFETCHPEVSVSFQQPVVSSAADCTMELEVVAASGEHDVSEARLDEGKECHERTVLDLSTHALSARSEYPGSPSREQSESLIEWEGRDHPWGVPESTMRRALSFASVTAHWVGFEAKGAWPRLSIHALPGQKRQACSWAHPPHPPSRSWRRIARIGASAGASFQMLAREVSRRLPSAIGQATHGVTSPLGCTWRLV
jgi:hypothetical protein